MAEDPTEINTEPPKIQDISKAVASELLTAENAAKLANTFASTFSELIASMFYGATVVLTRVAGPIAVGVARGQAQSEDAYNEVAATMLSGMFNTNIGKADVGAFGRGDTSKAGGKIADALFSRITTATGPIEPTSDPAKKFIAAQASRVVENWVSSFIFEIVTQAGTAGFIKPEEFGELGNELIDALGLNRTARRVLAPLVNATVVTPFQWQVNKTYRPELLTLSQSARQYLRGRKTRERFFEEGARAGLDDGDIEATLNAARQKLSIDDWLWLERWAKLPTVVVDSMLADLGCDDVTRNDLRRLQFEQRRAKYQIEIANEVETAYLDGHASDASLRFAHSQAYPDVNERELRRSLVDSRMLNRRKRLSHAEIKEAVRRGILSPFDYRGWLRTEGYDEDSVTTLELLLVGDINAADQAERERQRIAREKAEAARRRQEEADRRRRELEARQAAQIPPLADLKSAVIRGLIAIERYADSLRARGYRDDDIAFLVTMLEQDRDRRIEQEDAHAGAPAQATDRGASLAQIERAVIEGILGVPEYGQRLDDLGYNATDRALLVALITDRLQERRDAERIAAAAGAELAKRGLSLSQAERATRLHVWTPVQFRSWLAGAGLDDVAVATLAATMDALLAADAAAEARRATVSTELAARGVSLAQLEQAVLRGVTGIPSYRAKLLELRYGVDDVNLLVALLEARLADVVAARAKHDEAESRAADRRLTLAQVERGVILGHVTLDAYWQYLAELGYGDDDRAVLQANLMRALQDARERDASHDQLIAALGSQAGSVRALEADVIAGDADVDDYRARLLTADMTAAGVATCVAWLRDRVDDARDAERLAAAIDAELVAAKALTLGQWHDAVQARLRTLSDYRAFLIERYEAGDAEVLVALLAAQLAREASQSQ